MKQEYRDRLGRFEPGSPGGPGRPKREIEAEYLEATVAAVSLADWASIVTSMVNFAKAGNVQAATWIANYIVGKPTEHIAVSTEEPTSYELILPRGSEEVEQEFSSDNAIHQDKSLGSGLPNNANSDDYQDLKTDLNQE